MAGLAAQADRARSFDDFSFGANRDSAVFFCRELLVQLEAAIGSSWDDPHSHALYWELKAARRRATALRDTLEFDWPWFPQGLRGRLAWLLGSMIPEVIRLALADRADRAEQSRARRDAEELAQARLEVRAELTGDRQRTAFEWAPPTGMPGRTCRRLVTLAVCVLPANQRARYGEEFRADLWEQRRSRRLGYAIRLLAYSWSLRRSLVNSAAIASVRRERA